MGWGSTLDEAQTRYNSGSTRPRTISNALLLLSLAAFAPPMARAQSVANPSASVDPSHRNQRLKELRRRVEAEARTNPVDSVACGEEALQLLKGDSKPKDEIWFLLALIRDLRVVNEYAKAYGYIARARPLIAQHGDITDHFQLEVIASALLLDQEHYSECKAALDPLLPQMEAYVAKRGGDLESRRTLGNAYRICGSIQVTFGAVEDAIRLYRRAQTLYSEVGDQRGQGWVLDQMSALYLQMKGFDEAERSSLQAISQAQALRDEALEAMFRMSLSNIYGARNDANRQLSELKKGAQLAERAKDNSLTLTILINTADVYLQKKDYQASLNYTEEAMRLAKQANDSSAEGTCQANRGIALNRLGKSAEGIQAIKQALEHFKAVQSRPQVVEIAGLLAEEYAFAGDYRKAYETQVIFKTLSDELLKEQDHKLIAEASAGFESDKKQIQIDALQRDKRHQSWLRLLWITIGGLGFTTAAITITGWKKLKRRSIELRAANEQNLGLIEELKTTLSEIKTLEGLIPICSYCRKIRDDEGYWSQIEQHIQRHSKAKFSHGICPECAKEVRKQWASQGILPQTAAEEETPGDSKEL